MANQLKIVKKNITCVKWVKTDIYNMYRVTTLIGI